MTDQELRDFFLGIPTGPVSDAMELLGLRNWTDGLYPINPGKRLFGPAFTLHGSTYLGPHSGQCSYKVPDLVGCWQDGDILVTQGSVGSINAGIAANFGIVGIVCNGKCRDYAELGQAEIPVFCRGAKVRLDRTSLMLDAYNVPIVMAGATINPGDYLFGDSDGIVVIPHDRLSDVIYQTQMVLQVEQELHQAVRDRRPIEVIKTIIAKKRKPRL